MQRSAKVKSPKVQNTPANIKRGIAIWLSFLGMPAAIALFPAYFGTWTVGFVIALFFLGISGLGIQLDKLYSKGIAYNKMGVQSSDLFTSLGIGVSFLMIWIALNVYYFELLWVRWSSLFFLLFGLLGVMIGVVDLVFWYALQGVSNPSGNAAKPGAKQAKVNNQSFWGRSKAAFWVVGTIITIFAALLQALQILKVIP